MRSVEKLKEEAFTKFVDIVVGAYPGMSDASQQSKEQLTKFFVQNQHNNPAINYYGLWTDGKLIGGMRLHDIAELSSLVMGILTIKELFMRGKVKVSNEQFNRSVKSVLFLL